MVNKNLFVSRMKENGYTNTDISKELGIGKQTLWRKVNGYTEFKLSEIEKIIKLFYLTPEDTIRMFFK